MNRKLIENRINIPSYHDFDNNNVINSDTDNNTNISDSINNDHGTINDALVRCKHEQETITDHLIEKLIEGVKTINDNYLEKKSTTTTETTKTILTVSDGNLRDANIYSSDCDDHENLGKSQKINVEPINQTCNNVDEKNVDGNHDDGYLDDGSSEDGTKLNVQKYDEEKLNKQKQQCAVDIIDSEVDNLGRKAKVLPTTMEAVTTTTAITSLSSSLDMNNSGNNMENVQKASFVPHNNNNNNNNNNILLQLENESKTGVGNNNNINNNNDNTSTTFKTTTQTPAQSMINHEIKKIKENFMIQEKDKDNTLADIQQQQQQEQQKQDQRENFRSDCTTTVKEQYEQQQYYTTEKRQCSLRSNKLQWQQQQNEKINNNQVPSGVQNNNKNNNVTYTYTTTTATTTSTTNTNNQQHSISENLPCTAVISAVTAIVHSNINDDYDYKDENGSNMYDYVDHDDDDDDDDECCASNRGNTNTDDGSCSSTNKSSTSGGNNNSSSDDCIKSSNTTLVNTKNLIDNYLSHKIKNSSSIKKIINKSQNQNSFNYNNISDVDCAINSVAKQKNIESDKNFEYEKSNQSSNINSSISTKYRSLIMITSHDQENNNNTTAIAQSSSLSSVSSLNNNIKNFDKNNLRKISKNNDNDNSNIDQLIFTKKKEIEREQNVGEEELFDDKEIEKEIEIKEKSNISLSQKYRKYMKTHHNRDREDQRYMISGESDRHITDNAIDVATATTNEIAIKNKYSIQKETGVMEEDEVGDQHYLYRRQRKQCKLVTNENESVYYTDDDDDYDDDDDVENFSTNDNDVTVITGNNTLSAVVCLEDGLADDDSWVEEVSHDEDEFIGGCGSGTATESDVDSNEDISLSALLDREERLRGYNRTAIDFTLHTIVEESCEDSEIEQNNEQNNKKKNRMSASDLEKYFFYGLGDGKTMNSLDTKDDSTSEVSSVCSEGLDSFNGNNGSGSTEDPSIIPVGNGDYNSGAAAAAADLASSRLEKYFLSGFMGFSAERNESDESGSVGSDSEGHPSPSQRRKRLVRARGTPRSHSSSLDNLLTKDDSNNSDLGLSELQQQNVDHSDSSESEVCDETVIYVDKNDGQQNDTMKRKKQNRKRHDSDRDEKRSSLESTHDPIDDSLTTATTAEKSECKTIQQQQQQNQDYHHYGNLSQSKKQHSRDSGFIGSNDDLLKNDDTAKVATPPELLRSELEKIREDSLEAKDQDNHDQFSASVSASTSSTMSTSQATAPLASNLIRKDSFNNWSSDEETNLMMSKMRQFFKTLVAASANVQMNSGNSRTSTPSVIVDSPSNASKQSTPTSRLRNKTAKSQLVYFENELTRLMKTVPGINDEQVREIVEYLSSEDTWSDSYDSSDYTSSDLEGAVNKTQKAELKEQISASCQQIINKFDCAAAAAAANDEEGDRGDGGLIDESQVLNPETALVYQKLVASFSKMATGGSEQEEGKSTGETPNRSPQLLAKVMHHIGTRLVALMHEVSSGADSHASNSPVPVQRQHKKLLHQKISATTTEDDDSLSENNMEKTEDSAINNLPRSKSHDLLLSESRIPHHHQSSSGVSDTAGEEKEASDYERFSWRGSFESALLANGDSRTKLTLLDRDHITSSASALAAKRRSAGDLLFNHQKSLSREQLDRVRSCGSIGGNGTEHDLLESSKSLWSSAVTTGQSSNRRRSSVPDAICESGDSSDDDDDVVRGDTHNFPTRSTLPRSLQGTTTSSSTNSLPRLSTTTVNLSSSSPTTATIMQKSQSVYHFLPNSVKSARYRPSPGHNLTASNNTRSNVITKKSSSTSGLQQLLYAKRDMRRKLNLINGVEEGNNLISAAAASGITCSSPLIGGNGGGNRKTIGSGSGSASPIASHGSASSDPWPSQSEEDIDRLVALHQNRNSLSSLGVRSDSMASVYSGAGEGRYGTVVVKGQVEFGMQYNYKQNALEIHVVRCKDLAAVDVKRNRSDPYVKVYLLPDKSKSGKRKTKVKKHTLNPIFDEILRFHMPLSSLESRTLWLTVWHSDMFGRNNFLGEVTINLQGKVFDNPQSQWYLLQERSEPYEDLAVYRGDIIVGLKFVPPSSDCGGVSGSGDSKQISLSRGSNTNLRKFGSIKSQSSSSSSATAKKNISTKGQLHVLVKEAKNLTPVKASGSCDAFCKSYLLPDKTRTSKQKTHVIKRSINPIWNYTFIYEDVSLEELSERALELTVWDHDRLASNEFLGGIRFSLGTGKHYGKSVDWMDATGKELSLWQNMLNRPNFWVEGALVLRSSLDNVKNVY